METEPLIQEIFSLITQRHVFAGMTSQTREYRIARLHTGFRQLPARQITQLNVLMEVAVLMEKRVMRDELFATEETHQQTLPGQLLKFLVAPSMAKMLSFTPARLQVEQSQGRTFL